MNRELIDFTVSSVKTLGLTIDTIQAEQFVRYLNHLIEWNKAINLTAIIDPKEIIIKHFVDSLAALAATTISQHCLLLDVGTGGGFPGLPLKIARPDIRLVLVEPVQKKCSFLHSIIGLLKLHDISIFNGTISEYSKISPQLAIETVVVRALKFDEIQQYIPSFLKSRGTVVMYRTESLADTRIGDMFHLLSEREFLLPYGAGKRVISLVELVKL